MTTSPQSVPWLLLAGIAGAVLCVLVTVHLLVEAWHTEREHAAYLYDCCHMQSPEVCENNWLRQEAAK